jgi:hypothetical protein
MNNSIDLEKLHNSILFKGFFLKVETLRFDDNFKYYLFYLCFMLVYLISLENSIIQQCLCSIKIVIQYE